MKLYEIESPSEQAKKIAEFIKRECTDTLSRIDPAKPLYRGTQGRDQPEDSDALYFFRAIRADRKALGTDEISHHRFINHLKSQGVIANRNNSAFVTGDKYAANLYGTVYAVFPVGSINFTWSPNIRDTFVRIDSQGYQKLLVLSGGQPNNLAAELMYIGDHNQLLSRYKKGFHAALSQDTGDDRLEHNIDKYRYAGTEGRITKFPKTTEYVKSVFDALQDRGYDEFLNAEYQVKTQDNSTLQQAIESKNEIMITCSEMKMLYVDQHFYEDLVLPLLGSQ